MDDKNLPTRELGLAHYGEKERQDYLLWLCDRMLDQVAAGQPVTLTEIVNNETAPNGMKPSARQVWRWLYSPENKALLEQWHARTEALTTALIDTRWPTLISGLITSIEGTENVFAKVQGMRLLQDIRAQTDENQPSKQGGGTLVNIMMQFKDTTVSVARPATAALEVIEGTARVLPAQSVAQGTENPDDRQA